ncbi:MAG: hypothetical protein LC641_00680 [Spirochaeta sp.]|nr:hypothetical protein [Spirochaeta sp.]
MKLTEVVVFSPKGAKGGRSAGSQKHVFFHLFALGVLLLAGVSSCLSPGPGTGEPRFNFRGFSDRDSVLYFALREADQVEDISNRIFVFSEIAAAYLVRRELSEAQAVLTHLDELSQRVTARSERAEILVELSELKFQVNNVEAGLRALNEALDIAATMSDQGARGALYERIIQVAFEVGEDAFPVVARTIDLVLVIDDLHTRATVLTNTARRYQRQGLGQSGNILIQQAIPAAGSIGSPWRRAAALSAVALRFRAVGDARSATQYADRAADQLIGLTVLSLPDDDARVIADVGAQLAEMDRFSTAAQVVAAIPQSHIRADALVTLGEAYARSGDRPSAFVMFSRAASEAERSGNPSLIAGAYASIANGYLSIGEEQLAYLNAEFARSIMDGLADEFSRSSVLVRLVPVYVAAGAGVELEAEALELQELFPRIQVLTTLTREYASRGEGADARRPLDTIRTNEAEFAAASESLIFSVLQQYVALFLIEDALELVVEIRSPFLRARAFAGIGSAQRADGEFYSGPIVVP